MTIQQMEYFISCVSLLSFRKAADVHYTSPSTITRQVASLEQELGVTLLERNTHGVGVTEDGKLFFLMAQNILSELTQYRENLVKAGRLPKDETPYFHICTYPCDGMYRLLVDMLHGFPSDWLAKPAQFLFPHEGAMIETVRSGAAEIGVDSAELLKDAGDEFETKVLHTSPFRLIVGKNHPLYGEEKISAANLIQRFPKYGDYLPAPILGFSLGNSFLRDTEELRRLGEYTIQHIPQLFPYFDTSGGDTPSSADMMFIVPKALELLDFAEFHSVAITGKGITTDYTLFWRKDNSNPDIKHFLEMTEYI